MKTETGIRQIKRMVLTSSVFLFYSIALTAQPAAAGNAGTEEASARLKNLMETTEKSLAYNVPEEHVDQALQNLEWLVTATEMDMQYMAPAAADDQDGEQESVLARSGKRIEPLKAKRNNVQLETTGLTLQEVWLINAGYYKSARTVAKRGEKHLAAK